MHLEQEGHGFWPPGLYLAGAQTHKPVGQEHPAQVFVR